MAPSMIIEMGQSDKVRENRLRRMADRQGLRLVKSRRRDERAVDYGGYMLVDVQTGGAVCGYGPFGYAADLDEVEAYLKDDIEEDNETAAAQGGPSTAA